MQTELTIQGRRYAELMSDSSPVARVALRGQEYGWPPDHVAVAIGLCNTAADDRTIGTCVLCGEPVMSLEGDDPAEMHDPNMFDPELTEDERMVAQERVPSNGVCHAQCGLDRGWVVS